MGAVSGVQIIIGSTLEKAFNEARQNAVYEHGAGGYSGTLAESHGVRLMAQPKAEWDACQAAYDLIDQRKVEKWGESGAIPIWEPTEERFVRTFTLDTAGMEYDQIQKTLTTEVANLRRYHKRVGNGNVVEGVLKLEEKDAQQKLATKVQVPTPGTKKIYEVVNEFGRPAVTNKFESQAKARAAAVILADRAQYAAKFYVQCRIVRLDDSPLVTVERQVLTQKHTYEVTFVLPSDKPITRWYIAGVYSS